MFNHFERTWDFDLVVDSDVQNLNRVHPLKQREVIAIVNAFKQYDYVKLIVIFGSAVEFRCHSRSDIDIYIETDDKDARVVLPYDELTSEVDLIRDLNHDTRLFQQIEKTGIIVWDKERVYV